MRALTAQAAAGTTLATATERRYTGHTAHLAGGPVSLGRWVAMKLDGAAGTSAWLEEFAWIARRVELPAAA